MFCYCDDDCVCMCVYVLRVYVVFGSESEGDVGEKEIEVKGEMNEGER